MEKSPFASLPSSSTTRIRQGSDLSTLCRHGGSTGTDTSRPDVAVYRPYRCIAASDRPNSPYCTLITTFILGREIIALRE